MLAGLDHVDAQMSRQALVGLILTVLGTLGVGLIPFFGLAAGFGGPIVFRSPKWAWRSAWVVSWFVFVMGAVLSALH